MSGSPAAAMLSVCGASAVVIGLVLRQSEPIAIALLFTGWVFMLAALIVAIRESHLRRQTKRRRQFEAAPPEAGWDPVLGITTEAACNRCGRGLRPGKPCPGCGHGFGV